MITIYTDGGARGNPGPAGAGAIIFDEKENMLKESSRFLGVQTNNWAEYEGVVLGLEEAKALELFGAPILFKLDSQLIVEQLNGNYKVKDPNLREQFNKVNNLIEEFVEVKFTHIPRAENAEADRLANEAMDSGK